MKKLILSLLIISAMIGGCKKASTTNYCYRCATIQYSNGSFYQLLGTNTECNSPNIPGFVYQKGDSFIYQEGGNQNDTVRCFRYQQ